MIITNKTQIKRIKVFREFILINWTLEERLEMYLFKPWPPKSSNQPMSPNFITSDPSFKGEYVSGWEER